MCARPAPVSWTLPPVTLSHTLHWLPAAWPAQTTEDWHCRSPDREGEREEGKEEGGREGEGGEGGGRREGGREGEGERGGREGGRREGEMVENPHTVMTLIKSTHAESRINVHRIRIDTWF